MKGLKGRKMYRSKFVIRASPPSISVCDSAKNVSHIQVLVTNLFPTPPIKLKVRGTVSRWKTTK
jgi:hypothetical protein